MFTMISALFNYKMIHEAKIKFHSLEFFNFTRKQDANNYKTDTEYDLEVMFDRINLTFLVGYDNPLCKIKTIVIDFNVKNVDGPV